MKASFKLLVPFLSVTLILPLVVFAVDRTAPFTPGQTIDPGAESVEPCGPLDDNCFPSISPMTTLEVTGTSTLVNVLPGIASQDINPTVSAVDSTGDVGMGASMDLGDDGFARIAYFDRTNDTIKYARCLDGDCSTKNVRTIEATGNDFNYADISLKIGSDDLARIAYHDEANKRLKYAICNDADCSSPTIQVVDDPASGNSGRFPSLALDSSDNPFISYHKGAGTGNGGNLILARYVGSAGTGCTGTTAWKCILVEPLPYDAMLTLGNDGFPRIAIASKTNSDWDGEELKLVVCSDLDCITHTATTILSHGTTGYVGENASIAIKSDGNPVIVAVDSDDHEVKLVECTNATCSAKNVSSVYTIPTQIGAFPTVTVFFVGTLNISLDSNDIPRVLVTNRNYSYINNVFQGYNNSLYYVLCSDSACSSINTETLDTYTGNASSYPHQTMVLGGDGFARIAYYESEAGNLNYIRLSNDNGAAEELGSSIGSLANPFRNIYTQNLNTENLSTSGLTVSGSLAIGTTSSPSSTLDVYGKTASFNTAQDGTLTAWTTNANNLLAGHERGTAIAANGYLYSISGLNTTQVEYAKINSNGSVGSWSATSGLNNTYGNGAAVTSNGYAYFIGGGQYPTYTTPFVYYSKINSNGTLGTWTSNAYNLPTYRGGHTAVISNGYLYVIGGGSTADNASTTITYARLNGDGTTGSWTNASNLLPVPRVYHSSVVANGYVYVIGGFDGSVYTSTVYKARINSDGSLGSWSLNTNSLPVGLEVHSSVVVNGHIYVYGGQIQDTGTPTDWQSKTYVAKINSDGTTGAWEETTSMPGANIFFGAAAYNGYVYAVGGYRFAPLNSVYYASTARVSMASNLDLLNLTASGGAITGSSGDIGGSIFAGNIFSANNLEVQGNTQLWNGLSVNGPVSISGNSAKLLLEGTFTLKNKTASVLNNILSIQTNGGKRLIEFGTEENEERRGKITLYGTDDGAGNYERLSIVHPGDNNDAIAFLSENGGTGIKRGMRFDAPTINFTGDLTAHNLILDNSAGTNQYIKFNETNVALKGFIEFAAGADSSMVFQVGGNGPFNGGVQVLTLTSTGNAGIGTSTPWKKFSVAGGVSLTGLTASGGSDNYLCLSTNNEVTTGASCPGSSERFKHDIQTLSSNLDEVMKLRPVTFEYNDVSGTRIGLIAEEVNVIDPRLVFFDEDGTTPRGVRYQDFVPLLAGAIQEQQINLDSLNLYVGASTTDESEDSIYSGGLFTKLASWAGNIKNKIEDFFAKRIHTETLCVGKENDETCITKDQLDLLINNAGGTSSAPASPEAEHGATSTESALDNATSTSSEDVTIESESTIETASSVSTSTESVNNSTETSSETTNLTNESTSNENSI